MEKKNRDHPVAINELLGLIQYAHQVGSAPVVPTEEGKIKANALRAMEEQTNSSLEQIYQQLIPLAQQISDIKKRVEISHQIYTAKIPFTPAINHTYYLYQKGNSSEKILSIVSPEEWGENCPYSFISSVKLLSDHTWKIIDKN